MSVRCVSHQGREAGFRCASCHRALCEECRTHAQRDEHFCAACVDAIRRTSPLVRPLFAAGLFVAGAVPLASLVAGDTETRAYALVAYAALAITTISLSYKRARRLELDFDPERRPAPERQASAAATSTYRSVPRRIEERVRALVPPISASWATLIVAAALAFPALAVPAMASLPRWLEVEAVLALWWLAGTLGLGHLLFYGTVAADDDRLEDRGRIEGPSLEIAGAELGCAGAVSSMTGLALLLFFAWLLAELVFPALFLAAYAMLAMLIRAATRDRHDCRGHLGRSLRWGGFWATFYTLPLAIVVALVHLVLATR